MFENKIFKFSLCHFLVLCFLTFCPGLYAGEKDIGLISTSEFVTVHQGDLGEKSSEKVVDRTEIKKLLLKNGLSEKEIDTRLASMSDREVQTLNQQIDKAQAGGLLVAILVVILIIYFAQRI